MDKNLEKTRRKLALQFAVIVLVLFWIIGLSFFVFRIIFHKQISQFKLLDQEKIIEKMLTKDEREESRPRPMRRPLQFLVIEKETQEEVVNRQAVFEKEELLALFNNNTKDPIELKKNDENFIISFFEWVDPETKQHLVIFTIDRFPFNFKFFVSESLYYLLFTLVLSFIMYFIGYYFTGRNLKPVEKMIRKLEQFTHDASHELKTPISVIYSDLQLALKTKKYKKAIESSIEEVQALNKLVEDLLALAQIEHKSDFQEVNLSKVIQNVIKKMESQIMAKKIIIEADLKLSCKQKCNKDQLAIIVSNILDNAIKYSNPKGKIELNLNDRFLSIKDYGTGIKKTSLKKIFNRFFQEESSRSAQGFGVGLSIVKKIVDEHGWKIKVISQKNQGTEFIVSFS